MAESDRQRKHRPRVRNEIPVCAAARYRSRCSERLPSGLYDEMLAGWNRHDQVVRKSLESREEAIECVWMNYDITGQMTFDDLEVSA